jgi:phosphate transport system substrate-binding protein
VILGRTSLLSLVVVSVLLLCSCRPAAVGEVRSTAIETVGSDTMVNLALAWAEAYATVEPEVRVSITGGGSGTGIASLVNGTIDIATASRRIKREEIAAAEANGVAPIEHVVARDAIAVVVHPDNPVDRLTIAQVSAIYQGLIVNWSEVGGEDRPIVLLSRETNSGTHVYFLEEVIRQRDAASRVLFSRDTLLLPSSEGISAEVRQNPNVIGYDGLGYVTPDQKMVSIASQPGGDYVLPSVATVNDGSYPIARELYMYTAGEPTGVVADYINWVMGPRAQEIVEELGFVPLQR